MPRSGPSAGYRHAHAQVETLRPATHRRGARRDRRELAQDDVGARVPAGELDASIRGVEDEDTAACHRVIREPDAGNSSRTGSLPV
jgi:hypothetical protein